MTALTLLWLSDLLCVDGGCHFLCPGNLPVRIVGSGGGGGVGGGGLVNGHGHVVGLTSEKEGIIERGNDETTSTMVDTTTVPHVR